MWRGRGPAMEASRWMRAPAGLVWGREGGRCVCACACVCLAGGLLPPWDGSQCRTASTVSITGRWAAGGGFSRFRWRCSAVFLAPGYFAAVVSLCSIDPRPTALSCLSCLLTDACTPPAPHAEITGKERQQMRLGRVLPPAWRGWCRPGWCRAPAGVETAD